jgi:hypothetical protein
MTDRPEPLVPAAASPREEAALRRQVRYSDGKPCVHGHVGERFTRNASCVECQRIRVRADKARIRRLLQGAPA